MKLINSFHLVIIFSLALAGLVGPVEFGQMQSRAAAAAEGPLLHLRSGNFDPLQGEPANYPAALAGDLQPDQNGLRIVQFTGPIQDAWWEAAAQSGLEIAAYLPDYAYLVWGSQASVERLAKTVPLNWAGVYRPAYALEPTLAQSAEAQELLEVLVQVYSTPETDATLAQIEAAGEILRAPYDVLAYRNVGLRLPADRLTWLAALPGVIDVEPFPRPVKLDEVQSQILAGNLSGNNPSGPGYLAWLQSKGFSTNPDDYPIVDITDDGIDDGDELPNHPDFYRFGSKSNPDRLVYNLNLTSDAAADGAGGHGNLNAGIVGGYNDLSGSAYKDSSGFSYGLGINPYGRLAGTKVFKNSGDWDFYGTNADLVSSSYARGARISSNSWGSNSNSYTVDDQDYDRLTRDSVPGVSGHQPMILIFAAGNSGAGVNKIASPGQAKNVITVGASENVRTTLAGSSWTDACGVPSSGANSAFDVIPFSSRGPTSDGRIKPEIMAPGTHIISAASQVGTFNASGVCPIYGSSSKYAPAGQTLYTSSSGTSHSTPAVAGAASLLYRYYQVNFGGQAPSPAMVRAFLTNTSRYMTGVGANDVLPSINQGLGLLDLGRGFDGLARRLVDQSQVFGSSGAAYTLEAMVTDPGQPVRVSLAWTDAPGMPAASSALVNNLDLEVEIGGQLYRGNVFQSATSKTGGTADTQNNLESVFLPAGTSGSFTVRVKATNIAGDGVPDNGDSTDQDFALVVYNASAATGTIQGTVTAGGVAVGGTIIQAASSTLTQTVATDANGYYSLQLPVGNYTLSAWKYGYAPQSAAISVAGGTTQTRNFALTTASVYTLSGCATDQITAQGLKIDLTVSDPFGALVAQTSTSLANTCYSLNLSQGVFTLRAKGLLHQEKQVTVNLNGPKTQNLALAPTTTDGILMGVVSEAAGGAPVAGASILVKPGNYTTASGSDGSFAVQLPPGTYSVDVSASLYSAATASGVGVPQSNLVERNFALDAPKLALTPGSLGARLAPGASVELPLNIANLGALGLNYVAYESDGRPPTAGPDTYGYMLLDSRSTGGVTYNWVDMTGATTLSLTDDGEANLTLPFAFTFYGVASTSLRVGNNGAVLFNAVSGDVLAENVAISSAPNYLIAPYWDDLAASSGSVAYRTLGLEPERRFVLAWQGRPHYDVGNAATFQLILYEGSNNIKFQYQDISFNYSSYDYGGKATIGLRGTADQQFQVSYNTASLANNLALCYQHPLSLPCDPQDIAWLAAPPLSGSLAGSAPQFDLLTLDAAATPGQGGYTAVLRFLSNDPSAQPYRDLLVSLGVFQNPVWLPVVRK